MIMLWQSSGSTLARHLEVQLTYFILHVTSTELVLGEVLRLPYRDKSTLLRGYVFR